MILLALLGLGVVVATMGGTKRSAPSSSPYPPELDNYAMTCELDDGLSEEQAAVIRLKMSSALQGFTSPMELYQYGEELEALGFSKSAMCCKLLATSIQTAMSRRG